MEYPSVWQFLVVIISAGLLACLLGRLAFGPGRVLPSVVRGASLVLVAALLTACGGGITKIKYVYHQAGDQIIRPSDQEVLTAPAGKHYAVFLVNCIDNSSRGDAFGFSTTRLRAEPGNSQLTPLSGQFPPYQENIPAGEIRKGAQQNALAKAVFLLDGEPTGGVINYLNHDTQGDDSVLMVNQTVYGPLVSTGAPINYSSITGSPFFKNTDLCADSGSYH